MSNEELIGRFYREMWDRFDESMIPLLLAEDFRFRGSLGYQTVGHAQFAEYMRLIRRGFPDFTNHVEETITQGDRTFARLTYRGTHMGEVLGIPPTGRRVEYAGAAVFRFRGGGSPRRGCWGTCGDWCASFVARWHCDERARKLAAITERRTG